MDYVSILVKYIYLLKTNEETNTSSNQSGEQSGQRAKTEKMLSIKIRIITKKFATDKILLKIERKKRHRLSIKIQ